MEKLIDGLLYRMNMAWVNPYKVLTSLKQSFYKHYRYTHSHFKIAGLIGFIGYPLFYILYTEINLQPYENLSIRVIATTLCFFLMLKDYWPSFLRRYYPVYAWLSIFYLLPFFHAFMVFKSGGSLTYIIDTFRAVFFTILLMDWMNAIVILTLGNLFGIALYWGTTDIPSIPAEYIAHLPTMILVMIGGAYFKLRSENIDTERQKAAALIAGNIAHEMRTPLLGIKLTTAALVEQIGNFSEIYRWALKRGWTRTIRTNNDLSLLEQSGKRIIDHVDAANMVIDMLLMNIAGDKALPAVLHPMSMGQCIHSALDRFPFTDTQHSLVKTEDFHDFSFRGVDLLMCHVLFNLIKNALRAIDVGGKGDIVITSRVSGLNNDLIVRDTAHGIAPDILPYIFIPLYTDSTTGSNNGVGLTFCKTTIESFGGTITCTSKFGQGTELVMSFPKIQSEASLFLQS